MNVRLTHIDGKLPNIALMRLADWHRSRGDSVYFTRRTHRALWESDYDRVYASTIFNFSERRLAMFRREFPDAVVGGTGSGNWDTLEQAVGPIPERLDYSIYPGYEPSIGFLQRGCRLSCKFCVVPQKEGKPRQTMTVAELWRGEGHARNLHILDNDFFGVPGWNRHVADFRDGGFKVCLNQGINVRMITAEAAEALASIRYYDASFRRRRIYTAWDNLGDERRFFHGIDLLEAAGIPPRHVMAYMLIGYAPAKPGKRFTTDFRPWFHAGSFPSPWSTTTPVGNISAFSDGQSGDSTKSVASRISVIRSRNEQPATMPPLRRGVDRRGAPAGGMPPLWIPW